MRSLRWFLSSLALLGALSMIGRAQQSTYVTDRGGQLFNVKAYGAAGNTRKFLDAAMTANSAILTSTSAAQFTSSDVGLKVIISGAGASGAALTSTVSAFVSSTQVTLANSASTTVSNAYGIIGTDDTAAVSAAYAAIPANSPTGNPGGFAYLSNSTGGILYFPPGGFLISAPNITKYGTSVQCAGPYATTLFLEGTDGFIINTGFAEPVLPGFIRDCSFAPAPGTTLTGMIHLIDMKGFLIENNAFDDYGNPGTHVGIYMENSGQWNERDHILNNSFFFNSCGIKMHRDTPDPNNSYGYSVITGDMFQIGHGANAICLENGATLYNADIEFQANTNGDLFSLSGSSALDSSRVHVHAEGGGYYLFYIADTNSNINLSQNPGSNLTLNILGQSGLVHVGSEANPVAVFPSDIGMVTLGGSAIAAGACATTTVSNVDGVPGKSGLNLTISMTPDGGVTPNNGLFWTARIADSGAWWNGNVVAELCNATSSSITPSPGKYMLKAF